jgi:hypothetical protein
MVQDYVEWFGEASPNVAISVVSGATPTPTSTPIPTPTPTPSSTPVSTPTPTPTLVNASQFIGQSVPLTMVAGETYPVTVTIRNTGTTTWTPALLYRLGSESPRDNLTWNIGRAVLSSSAQVAPGQQANFVFNVKAPLSGGDYVFQWGMVQDGVAWFGDKTSSLTVRVNVPVAPTPSPTPSIVPTPVPSVSPSPSVSPTPSTGPVVIATPWPIPTPTPVSTPLPSRIRLVKTADSPKVYYLTEGALKRWIPTAAIFVSYGNRWEDIVIIPQWQMDSYPNNILVKLATSPKVYKLENGKKRWIETATAFNRNGFHWDQIAPINQAEFDYYPLGLTIK